MKRRVQQVDGVPDELLVARLETISYEALRDGSEVEATRLFNACCQDGVLYLDMAGTEPERTCRRRPLIAEHLRKSGSTSNSSAIRESSHRFCANFWASMALMYCVLFLLNENVAYEIALSIRPNPSTLK